MSGEAAPMPEQAVERKLVAILAADIAGYSRLVGLDEGGILMRLRALRRIRLSQNTEGASSRPPATACWSSSPACSSAVMPLSSARILANEAA
jgi:hypothetical protein